jgi:hypothetical protein
MDIQFEAVGVTQNRQAVCVTLYCKYSWRVQDAKKKKKGATMRERHTHNKPTDGLGCQDVNETGGKEDEEDGQTDPGQVLQKRMRRQITIHPHTRCYLKRKFHLKKTKLKSCHFPRIPLLHMTMP